jgi:hypothetical protein
VGRLSFPNNVAIERMHSGDLEGAERRFNRAVPILRREGLWVQSLDAIGVRGLLHAMRLEYNEVPETNAWAIEQARRLGVPFYILENHRVWGMALANRGQLTQPADVLKSAIHLAELLDRPRERRLRTQFARKRLAGC